MTKRSKAGFTLAEVLTTLMVIGVVAALTIPTLLNSTSDQQFKTAFKKAASILSQGTQMMVAKEASCVVTDSASLAKCFNENVISGERVSNAGTLSSNDYENYVIKTSDGLAYMFQYAEYGATNTDSSRSIESICGSMADVDNAAGNNIADKYNGKNARCLAVVDMNGLSKGTKYFVSESAWAFGTNFHSEGIYSGEYGADLIVQGEDQAILLIFSDGIRPTYIADSESGSRGYKYMYGDVDPLSSN